MATKLTKTVKPSRSKPVLGTAGRLALTLSMLLTLRANANVVGNDTQNFNPTTSGLDFVTVQSSETLKPGMVNFGLFLNQAANSLPAFDEQDGSSKAAPFRNTVLGADLNIGIGLLDHWDLGLSIPQMVHQQVDGEGSHGQFSSNGNTEVRLNTKYRVWGDDSQGIAVIGSTNINRLKNNPYTGQNPGPTYNLELAFDTTKSNVALGVNVGYRWRTPGEKIEADYPIEPLENQMIGSVAASYLFASIDTKLIFEVFGGRPTEATTDFSDRLQSSAEALVGLKHDVNTNLAMHFGLGKEMQHGMSSPDWRAYAGINYALGPKFSRPEVAAPEADKAPTVVTEANDKDPFAGPPQDFEKIIIHDVLFEFDSADRMVGTADQTLARLVTHLNRAPVYTKLVIEGHTDSIGPGHYNDELSRKRAETIRRQLTEKHKLDAGKVFFEGHGERKPIADNGNYQGRQLNRRVEFRIYRK